MAQTRTAIGLDLGGQTVKLVRLAMTRRGMKVEEALIRDWPAELMDDPEAKASWLRELLQAHKVRGGRVLLTVSGSLCNVQLVKFPQASDASVARMAQMELQRLAGLSPQDVASDFVAFPALDNGESRALIALCRAATIQDEIKLAAEAGLSVDDISLSNLALHNALTWRPRSNHQGLTAFVDIGRDSTNIALSHDGAMVFARSFASGGGGFTSAVAHAGEVSMEEADLWKQNEGQLFVEGVPTGPKEEALHQAAEFWLTEFNETLADFFEQSGGTLTSCDRIVLSGGGAMLRNFPFWLAERTGLPIEILAPLKTIGADTEGMEPETAMDSRFTVATGLALQGLQEAPSLSLLPSSVKEQRVVRRRTRELVAYSALAALVFLTFLGAAVNWLNRVNGRLKAQHADLSKCQEMVRRIEELRGKTQRVQDMLEPIVELANRGDRLLTVWNDVCSQRNRTDWFTMIADGDSYFPADARQEPEPVPPPPARGGSAKSPAVTRPKDRSLSVVILEGYTPDKNLGTVVTLTNSLEKIPYFKKADFLREDLRMADARADERWGKTGHRRFTLELQLDWSRVTGKDAGGTRQAEGGSSLLPPGQASSAADLKPPAPTASRISGATPVAETLSRLP